VLSIAIDADLRQGLALTVRSNVPASDESSEILKNRTISGSTESTGNGEPFAGLVLFRSDLRLGGPSLCQPIKPDSCRKSSQIVERRSVIKVIDGCAEPWTENQWIKDLADAANGLGSFTAFLVAPENAQGTT
jgi:hypothetical protein